MKELYKLYSNPLKEKINSESKEDFGILEKYLAAKKNLEKLHEQTLSLHYSIDEKQHKDTTNQGRCGENTFTQRTAEIIEALKGFSPPGYMNFDDNMNYDQKDNLPVKGHNEQKNLELEKSIDYIEKTFRNVKQSIGNPVIARASTFLENEFEEEGSLGVNNICDEKTDKPKEYCSDRNLAHPPSPDNDNPVERILKMLEIDYKPSGKLDCGDIMEPKSSEEDLPILRSPFDIAHWDEQFQKYSYYSFFLLVCTLFILSILRSTNYLLKSAKKYFDKAIMLSWSWVRAIFVKTPNNDNNVLLFAMLTPFIILLLIAYSGLSILYFINKILLTRAPKVLVHQLSSKTL